MTADSARSPSSFSRVVKSDVKPRRLLDKRERRQPKASQPREEKAVGAEKESKGESRGRRKRVDLIEQKKDASQKKEAKEVTREEPKKVRKFRLHRGRCISRSWSGPRFGK